MTTVGDAVGEDTAWRLRHVEQIHRDLYEMHDAGALVTFEHRTEPARSGDRTVDLWELTFARMSNGEPEDHPWTYHYAAVRALIRGWRMGKRFG